MSEITLETKFVSEIEGLFYVPSYQRGYRWGDDEVRRLLDDINGIQDKETNSIRNYCLQPIVVKRNPEFYELIDGQQRLTTLFLVYKYMSVFSNGFIESSNFRLFYETRKDSEKFLENIDESRKEENIDFWFIFNAYKSIEAWFDEQEKKSVAITNINNYLSEHVKVIWYEIDSHEDSIALFTRLNSGKIPLTSSELVKAIFLSGNNKFMSREKQEEISLQWDNMEKDLHDEGLWYFLTNRKTITYPTRIDLVLDMISGCEAGKYDKYETFYYFDKLRSEKNLDTIWQDIVHAFLMMKEWYKNHELYHKIGYLISIEEISLSELYRNASNMTKKSFRESLDDSIRESIAFDESYGDLTYEISNQAEKIQRLLILFNVESVRQNGEMTQWFPFDKFKYGEKGEIIWTLEHIHAQQSQGLKKQEEWIEWLKLHLKSLKTMEGNHKDLIDEISIALEQNRIERSQFESLQQKVFGLFSDRGSVEFLHHISNLALLGHESNAALNNSTFDVKRNAVIEMDKKGQFIPFCTKMVFLKYYTPSEYNQIHFWGPQDRKAYIETINRVLEEYLSEPIASMDVDIVKDMEE